MVESPSKAGFPKLWVTTQKWVAKFCQVGRQSFLEISIFSHLFVNWIKILFSSYHCSRSSPLSCQRAKLIKIFTSRGNVTPTLRELLVSPRKCQNVPLNHGPSPYKIISTMFPHFLHLVHLSNPDELYDLQLKLILLSHDSLGL